MGGGCLGESGGMEGVPTCMHMHAQTCIKLQMATNMEASMFSMFIMFNMHEHACVHACVCICVHVCMHGTSPHIPIPTPTHIHPSTTTPSGNPESVKIR